MLRNLTHPDIEAALVCVAISFLAGNFEELVVSWITWEHNGFSARSYSAQRRNTKSMCNSLILKQASRWGLSEAMIYFVFCADRAAVHEVVLPCFSFSSLQSIVTSACINFLNRKKNGTNWHLNNSFEVFISMGRSFSLWGTYLTKRKICPCGESYVVSCFLHNIFVSTQAGLSLCFICKAIYRRGKI